MSQEIELSALEALKLIESDKKLEELSEEEVLTLAKNLASSILSEEVRIASMQYFDQDDSTCLGCINSYSFTLVRDEDEESISFSLGEIEYDEQLRDIQEILAGADRERPRLDEFFAAMAEKIRDEEMSYEEAWNEIVFDPNAGDSLLGIAIADFRDGELTERLGYEPDSEALDDALEQWISNFY